MAVDTAARRFSMISVGGELFANRVPDATDMDEQSDRQNEEFLYFGFGDSGAVTPSNPRFNRRRRFVAVA